MADTKPSERAIGTAATIAEYLIVETPVLHDDDCFDDPRFEERIAAIIDEHFRGHDGLLAIIVKLREAILDAKYTTQHCQCALHTSDAALAAAKENPNGG